jgi:hypothetical protein
MKKILLIIGFFSFIQVGFAQEEAIFTAEINKTTIGIGKKIKVTFTLKDATGIQFEAPDFEGFEVLGGPNVSSSMSIMNGDVSQSSAYTYYVSAKKVGKLEIPSAAIKVGKKTLRTAAIPITVVAQSDDDTEDEDENKQNQMFRMADPFADFFGRGQMPEATPKTEAPKKKRATTRM